MLEVFNLFNHKNYNSFVTNLSNVRYGQPIAGHEHRVSASHAATGVSRLILKVVGIGDLGSGIKNRGLYP
jgi:hypothetical protein